MLPSAVQDPSPTGEPGGFLGECTRYRSQFRAESFDPEKNFGVGAASRVLLETSLQFLADGGGFVDGRKTGGWNMDLIHAPGNATESKKCANRALGSPLTASGNSQISLNVEGGNAGGTGRKRNRSLP